MKTALVRTLACVILLCLSAVAQTSNNALVAIGAPQFSSLGNGPFDAVNLGNLNVHFSIPIFDKAGRGISFNQGDLSYDSSIWVPVGSSGSQSWQPSNIAATSAPVSYWGWVGLSNAGTSYVTYWVSGGTNNCGPMGQYQYTGYSFSNFIYYDKAGAHMFPNVVGDVFNSPGEQDDCPPDGVVGNTSGTASDGSGLTLYVNYNIGYSTGYATGYLITKSGAQLSPPIVSNPSNVQGSYTQTDANGNQITAVNGVYTDTLGTTALTVLGTQPNNTTLSYTPPSDSGTVSYTVSYKAYTVKTNFGCSGVTEYNQSNVYLVDKITAPDNSFYQFTYEQTAGGTSGQVTARLASVALPAGGSITYTYPTTSSGHNGINCSDGSAPAISGSPSLTRALSPGGTWTYTRSNVSGSEWTSTINDPTSPTNQTVISFQKDSASTQPTLNFYETQRQVYQGTISNNACSSTVTANCLLSTTITCYNGNSIGTPSSCPTTAVASPILRTTVFRYLPNSSGAQAETDSTFDQFGLVHNVLDYDYKMGSVGNLIRQTLTTYATLGNGIVDRPSSVTIEDGNNNVIAKTTYNYDETAATQTPVCPAQGCTPQHISITGSRGLLTSVIAQVNGTTNLYRKYTYYDTGVLSTSTDVSTSSTTPGATTTYNYSATNNADCGNAFVTSITEPLGLSRSMTWDCNGGVMLSLTDENNNITSTAYSGSNYTNDFWRPYSTTDQAGNVTNYFYYLNSSDQPFQTESQSAKFNGNNSIVDVLTTTDGFGRTLFRQTKQGPSATNYDTVATCYDNSGRISLTTLAYANAAITSTTNACPSSNYGTSYAYDALSRQTQVSDSEGGQTSYSYPDNDALQTLTSPTQQKQLEYDGLGRLRSVCEINSGTATFPSGSCTQSSAQTGYWTTYTYDALGDLTGVTQNAQASSSTQQSRSYVYDMLGRLTQEKNPETSNAATFYTYDVLTSDTSCGTYTSAGNMVKRLDPANNATCYTGYDALHRVGSISYPATNTPAKNFVYDAATLSGTSMPNAKTRLARAYTCNGTCTSNITDVYFGYFATGQTTDVYELTPHSSGYNHIQASYPWPNGALYSLSGIPGVPTVLYGYTGSSGPGTDGEGRVTRVAASGSSTIDPVPYNGVAYSLTNSSSALPGSLTQVTYGSGDSDSFAYDPKTGRQTGYTFSVNGVTDTGTLSWNTNGSLSQLAITDNLNSANSQTCNYTHDALGRVASANCGNSTWNQNFSYDPFGNITKTVPNGATGTSFNVNYDYTNNTNRVTTSPYSYTSTSDPNAKTGDMSADTNHTYSWDTDGHVVGIDSGTSNGVCLTYDALGRAVEKDTGSSCTISPTSSTEIVYSPSGSKLALLNGASLVKAFIPLPGGGQAIYNSSSSTSPAYFRHPDWLGSSRLTSTLSRAVYYDGSYAPFGENYAGSGTQDLAFTGQNQDTESSVSGGVGGLYDFLYREHSPVQGRWLSPDPAGMAAVNPADPQTWNRYAYVADRPLNSIDASGLIVLPCDPDDPSCGPPPPCDPSDPTCEPCDPTDPTCGPGPGPIIPPIPGLPPNPPERVGGVWPNNETLGLPQGLQFSPLSSLSSLIGLLPGLNCGGSASGFEEPTPVDTTSAPCIVLIAAPVIIAEGISAASSSGQDQETPSGIAIAVGTFKYVSVGANSCEYRLDCPNGNGAYGCSGTILTVPKPCGSTYMIQDSIVYRKGATKTCFGAGSATPSPVPVPCQ